MNIQKGKARFKKIQILLDSGRSSTIIMARLINKISSKKYAVVQWHTQADEMITNIKVNLDFTLTELSATKIVT